MITLDILASGAKIDYTRYSVFRGENRATDLLCDLRPKKAKWFLSAKIQWQISGRKKNNTKKMTLVRILDEF